jgi:glutathione reductase (NADPH)
MAGAQKFDLVAIGSGTAAATAAGLCRKQGWKVAIIDELPFGGTCALRGCDPKKILRRGAEIIDAARLLHGRGIVADGLKINWSQLVAFKRQFTDSVPERREHSFRERGIAALRGRAHFLSPTTLAVGDDVLEAGHILIGVGAKPAPLGVPGADFVTTSDQFMELERLPGRILFIGGGYISFEFAHMAVRAGAKVVVIDRGARPLKLFDPDLVDKLVERTRSIGIEFQPKTKLMSIEKATKGFSVTACTDGENRVYQTELVVHGAGRVPALDGLALEKAGVRAGPKGIEVNDYLQSITNATLYAAGDAAATAGAPLTPVANLEGEAAARNMIEGNHHKPDYWGVPSAAFTIPALARVGLLEQEAESRGLTFTRKISDMSDWYSTRRVGETHAAAKVLIESGSERILGAHLLGPESPELINFFALAMRLSLPASDLRKLVSAYPSAGSDLGYLV